MSWGLVAVAGATLVSGVVGSKSAGKSAAAGERASEAGITEQQRQFDITQGNLQPFQEAGTAALNQQRILLGLGGTDPNLQKRQVLQGRLDSINQEEQAFNERFGGQTTGRAGLINQAGQKLSGSMDFSGQRNQIQTELDALGSFSAGSNLEQQQAAFSALKESPGQQFIRERQQRSLVRGAAATGQRLGGNVLTALQEQGTGFAMQDIDKQFGRLGQLAGQGQAATTSLGQFGAQSAGNIQQGLQQAGQARQTGILNQNAAFQQTLGGLANVAGQFAARPTTT